MKLFTDHPQRVGETYFQHFRFAAKTGLLLLMAGAACLIHSVFPFVFTRTASQTIQRIHNDLQKRKMAKFQIKRKSTDWVI